jgi:uncharacterized integral membrane protein
MKKVKIAFWAVILIFIGIFVYQNEVYFMGKNSLSLKLPFLETLHTPELPNAFLFLLFFLIGFLIAYFLNLSERFKSKKTIKNLNAAATSQLGEISELKKEVESLRGVPSDNKEETK